MADEQDHPLATRAEAAATLRRVVAPLWAFVAALPRDLLPPPTAVPWGAHELGVLPRLADVLGEPARRHAADARDGLLGLRWVLTRAFNVTRIRQTRRGPAGAAIAVWRAGYDGMLLTTYRPSRARAARALTALPALTEPPPEVSRKGWTVDPTPEPSPRE